MDKKFILFICDKRGISQYIPVEDIGQITLFYDITEEKTHYECLVQVEKEECLVEYYVKNLGTPSGKYLREQLASIVVETKEEKATEIPWEIIPDEPERPGRYAAWKNKGKL